MSNSPANVAMRSAEASAGPVSKVYLLVRRMLLAGVVGGPIFGLAAVWAYAGGLRAPTWLVSIIAVVVIFMPALWVLAEDLRLHGLRGVSAARLMLVASGCAVVSILSLFGLLKTLFWAWPYLGFPPLPSD